jgi:ubiquinone/menaquinone biosynthesis C-methylase UbiE
MQTQGFDLYESNPCLFSKALQIILRTIYQLLYHSFAWSYDLVAAIVSFGKWNDWVREVLPLIVGDKVLEIGFGPGHLQVELIQRRFQVFGLDESPQMIRQAVHRIESKQFKPNFVRGKAQDIPFQSCFETVVATFPSEYIFDPKTIKEINRILFPGGLLIVLLSVLPPQGSVLNKILLSASGWLFRERPNPLENRLEQIIQKYQIEGFTIKKVTLERKSYNLILLVGEKSTALRY